MPTVFVVIVVYTAFKSPRWTLLALMRVLIKRINIKRVKNIKRKARARMRKAKRMLLYEFEPTKREFEATIAVQQPFVDFFAFTDAKAGEQLPYFVDECEGVKAGFKAAMAKPLVRQVCGGAPQAKTIETERLPWTRQNYASVDPPPSELLFCLTVVGRQSSSVLINWRGSALR